MIRRIYSDLTSFKSLTFHRGFNLLLADKSDRATDRQSRNGAGKTSLVELIHFIFGANADKSSIFRNEKLVASTFFMDLDIGGQEFTIARSGERPSRIEIRAGDPSSWPVVPQLDKKMGVATLGNDEWKQVLGKLLFDLSTKGESDVERFAPKFRQLFSYFARRQHAGAFIEPFRQAEKQHAWDQQVAISYLLSLDWTIPQQFEEVRQQEKAIQQLKQVAKEGRLPGFSGTAAELRTQVTLAQARVRRLRSQLEEFRVVPQYAGYEAEASRFTREIKDRSNQNTMDRELLAQLEHALEAEHAPGIANLQQLYREAGVVLPDTVVRRFEEVKAFHEAIVENRRAHLSSEIEAAKGRIADREQEMAALDEKRSRLMRILGSGGALEHFTALREELARAEAETEALRQRFETAEKLENTKTKLDIRRAQLLNRLQADYHEQEAKVQEAILTFEELSESLYERAGNLTINLTSNGPEFEIKIESARSKGIGNMQIFCFDLMLMEICVKRGMGPGFMIHDSHLFDGVDERQIAKAFHLAAKKADELSFQYIVTMNSDGVPKEELREDFDLSRHILTIRLTDATEIGGLFGLHFD